MKTRTMKSILSMILSLTLVMGLMTSTVFATDIEEPDSDPETVEEDLSEDDEDVLENTEDETESVSEQPDEEEEGTVLAEEDEEEDPGIQVFAATDENQTLKVVQKEQGIIGDDETFTYHLYQILEAAETIENMGDITESEPGADLDYVICDADGNEISSGTTDSEGTFALHVGETATFTLEAETSWYVYQDTPDAYPLISVDSDGEYAAVVDGTNGVVYYGQIEPEPVAPEISGLTVTSSLTDNEKTYDGGSVILTAGATVTPDTAAVSYQWYKDGEEISGATESTYTLVGNVSDSGTYKCVVTAENDGLTATAEAEATVTINKAAQNISYAVTEMDKTLGEEDIFTNVLTQTTVSKDDGAGITYSSSDETVATVDAETGEVTILAAGEVTITATAAETENYKEETASYTIKVVEQPVINELTITSNLTNNEKTYDGGEVILTANTDYIPETATIAYQWYAVDEQDNETEITGADGVTLTLDGNVSDSGTYKCIVTVTNDGLTATAEAEITITINKAAQEISYADTSVEKLVGDDSFTNELTETIVSSEEGSGITYASTDESVAIVDSDTGEVTILASGETTITATAAETANYAEASTSYTLTVREQPVINGLTITSNLTDNEKTYDGGEVILTANTDYIPDTATITYKWYAVDEEDNETEIIGANGETLSLEGNVSDSGTYKCVVTVTNDGLTATEEAEITITINKAEQDISYEESTVTKIDYDEDFIIELTETVVDGQITYASSDENVATIDPDTGEVHIVGTGYATITVTAAETDNYKEDTASYVLIVNEDVLDWEIDVDHDQVRWDEDKQEWVDDLTYTGEPMELEMAITLTEEEQEELEEITYQWYRYNAETQDFDEIDGATAEAYTLEGEDVNAGDYIYMCVAVVTYKNGYEHMVYSPIEVVIEKADQSIVFKEESLEAVAGYTITNEIITEESVIVGTLTYTSDDKSVATVDENGKVTIVGVGTVNITATAAETDNYNEASNSYTITTSDEVSLTITSDIEDEDNTKTYDGKTVTLTAEVSYKAGNGIYAYQWYTVADDETETEIDSETEAELTLDGNVADSGTYGCTVTVTYPNVAESVTLSDTITITINIAKQDISYEEDEIEKTTADEAFTNLLTETFVDPNGQITYASSDETVATVDAETGEVTIVSDGEVTITATAAATANCTEATASYTLTVMKAWDSVQYAVKLWGICTDTYSYNEGSTLQTASLTFGPATGANHLNSYVECSSETCIHKISWDAIIEYCNEYQGNSEKLTSLFGSCLENGCTKAVELTPNDTLFNITAVNNALAQGYTGDGVSTLYYLLNYDSSPAYACRWNYSYTGNSDSDPANIYSRSRIRATLTGDGADAKEWVANKYNNYYGVDTLCNESNCLLSCFPANLQAAVVPRTTLNSGNATSGSSRNADSKTTYDKLFLFSLKETGITNAYDDGGGSDYGVNPNDSDRVAYEFSGTSATTSSSIRWWSRSRYSIETSCALGVLTSGSKDYNYVTRNYGLSPGFCIK